MYTAPRTNQMHVFLYADNSGVYTSRYNYQKYKKHGTVKDLTGKGK